MTDPTQQQSPQIIYAFPPGMMGMGENNHHDDEINLLELWKIIWAGKWIIISCTFIAALIAVVFALSQPNYYKSTALLAPVSADGQGKLSGSLGGLAALAGVNLGGGGGADKTGLALQILKSRKFILEFVEKNNLVVPLMAAKKWNPKTHRLEINSDVYDIKTKKWLDRNPTDEQIYKAFSSVMNASQDKQTTYVNLSVEFLSPVLAQQWVGLLVKEINATLREKDINQAQKNINYLQDQAQKTGIVDFQNVFYSLIQEQIKTVMFAEGKEDYVFEYIDPPVAPEMKSRPKRSMMVIIGGLLGGFIGLIVVFIRSRLSLGE